MEPSVKHIEVWLTQFEQENLIHSPKLAKVVLYQEQVKGLMLMDELTLKFRQ
jgi:hypothetical protein